MSLLVAVVLGEQLRRPMNDLTDDTRRHIIHEIVDHTGFDVQGRPTGGARLAHLIGRFEHGPRPVSVTVIRALPDQKSN